MDAVESMDTMESTPSEVSEVPAEVSDAPAEVSDAPAEESEEPAEVSEAPTEVSEAPAEVSEALESQVTEDDKAEIKQEDGEVKITEDLILEKTGQKTLAGVVSLDFSGMQLEELDENIFHKVQNLETLNLSKNNLKSIPGDLGLLKLKKLDVSENKLDSLEFVGQFEELEELWIDGNGLNPSDKYIAALLCKNIKSIDKTNCESLSSLVTTFRDKLNPEVIDVWEQEFAEKHKHNYRLPQAMVQKVITDMSAKVKQRKLYGSQTLEKFRDFLIVQLCRELIERVRSGEYEPPTKKVKTAITPAKPEKEVKTKSGKANSQSFTTLKNQPYGVLPDTGDYDPVHFLRCHFCDRNAIRNGHSPNDPTDDMTKIWSCQFEPHPTKSGETTGVVATTGGDTVCLIDCSTGRVMKRYQQAKEQFYSLAWTTVDIPKKSKTNLLAVGGHNGHIKLLHPDQLVCYKQLGTGRPNRACVSYYISSIMFHPTQKTWLFSGASDTTVTLWDIGIPEGKNYEAECKMMTIFHATEGSGILNMVYSVETDVLVAGCESSCFAFRLDAEPHSKRHREPDLELELPAGGEAEVDGLALVAPDIVASKCAGESVMFLWKLSTHLKSKKKVVKVDSLMTIDYCETDVEYINMGSKGGVVATGDDRGNLWLYNLQHFAKNPKSQDKLMKPSRILTWPNCQLGTKEQSQKMKDVLNPRDIVVNCCTVSSSRQYIVAGTDNNLVCIWKRC